MRCRDDLSSIIDSSDCEIILLTETWLSSRISSSEIFTCGKKFNVYRQDRGERMGGGVLIAVADGIVSNVVDVLTDLEMLWVSVTVNYKQLILGVCYRPPNASSSFCEQLHDSVNAIVSRFPTSQIILLGDFNYPSIKWSTTPPTVHPFSSEGNDFINLCSEFNFSQLVDQPTRITSTSANILDLVLTTCPDLVSSILYLPGLSDHCLLHIDLNIPLQATSNTIKTIRDYSKANFNAINCELALFLDTFLSGFFRRSVNENWNIFKLKVNELLESHIPLKRIYSNSNAPWFTRTIGRLGNKKKRFFRAAKRKPTADRWDAYHASADLYRAAVCSAKSTYFNSTLPSMLINNPRQFWNTTKEKSSTVVELRADDGSPISCEECANELNAIFISCFSDLPINNDQTYMSYDYLPMYPISISPEGIVNIIDSLKLSSSCGIDCINSKFLKNTRMYSSILLASIFSQSLEQGILPDDWRVAKVVPVHKGGDKFNPRNFRPISLTSVPSKILEHIIYSNIVNFLESNKFFCPFQHGFRKTFSCETQLVSFTHDLHSIVDVCSKVDCVFLDFSKAFDKVPHTLLLSKLSKLNIDQAVLTWIQSFLTNRKQFVSVNNRSSAMVSVTSGVPQGSVLGPLLFLIYINDLPSHVSSKMSLFADDCVIYREITNDSDSNILQNDINSVTNWCDSWSMVLNSSKCKVMRVSRCTSSQPHYTLNNHPLELVTVYKYLGVHITSDLSWRTHINYIINNANRMLGFLKRNFFLAPQSLKLILYKTLVRSKLEYACSVWDPGQSVLIDLIEAVQNRSVRFIFSNYHRTASVSTMKSNLSLPELSTRRKVARLSLFHKIYFTNDTLRNNLIIPPLYVSPRLDHQHKVGIPYARTNVFHHSFIPSTSFDWNHLAAPVVSIIDHVLFKKALERIFF